MSDNKLLAVCGLDCAKCPAYIATKTNDDKLRAETVIKWNEQFAAAGANFKLQDINCVGCNVAEGAHIGHCAECAVRLCAHKRCHKKCIDCAEFSNCATRKDFEGQSGLNIDENFRTNS